MCNSFSLREQVLNGAGDTLATKGNINDDEYDTDHDTLTSPTPLTYESSLIRTDGVDEVVVMSFDCVRQAARASSMHRLVMFCFGSFCDCYSHFLKSRQS